jgi:hypothetical protein
MPKIVNAQQVIDLVHGVIQDYNAECNFFGFFSKPGKEGIQRKIKLLSILSHLDKSSSAALAISQLDDFCNHEKASSRLQKELKRALMDLFNIAIPRYSHENQLVYDQLVAEAHANYKHGMDQLRAEAGIERPTDIPLGVIARAGGNAP